MGEMERVGVWEVVEGGLGCVCGKVVEFEDVGDLICFIFFL